MSISLIPGVDPENVIGSALFDLHIEASVKFINDKIAETVLKGSIEIGEYVLKSFFNDDLELASSQDPFKSASYNALCSHPDLTVSRTTLARMVRVAAQERFFIANNIDVDKLSYTHRIELIKLENDDKKLELVQTCIESSLSSRKLISLINEARRALEESMERVATKMANKHIAGLECLLGGPTESTVINDMDTLRIIEKETRQKLRQTAASVLAKIPLITGEYQRLIFNLDQIEAELGETTVTN